MGCGASSGSEEVKLPQADGTGCDSDKVESPDISPGAGFSSFPASVEGASSASTVIEFSPFDAYAEVDEADNGKLTTGELTPVLVAKCGMSSTDVEELLSACEKDEDSDIGLLEFSKGFKKYKQGRRKMSDACPLNVFSQLDEDDTGKLPLQRFGEALISQGGMSPEEVESFSSLCPRDDDGMLSILQCSRVCKRLKRSQQNQAVKSTVRDHIRRASECAANPPQLRRPAEAPSTAELAPLDAFAELDVEDKGIVLVRTLKPLLQARCGLTASDVERLMMGCQRDAEGRVGMVEFCKGYKAYKGGEEGPATGSMSPLHVFGEMDEGNTGVLAMQGVRPEVFNALTIKCGMSSEDVDQFLMLCDKDNDSSTLALLEFSKGLKRYKKAKHDNTVKSTVQKHIKRASVGGDFNPQLPSIDTTVRPGNTIPPLEAFSDGDEEDKGGIYVHRLRSLLLQKCGMAAAEVEKLLQISVQACGKDMDAELALIELSRGYKQYCKAQGAVVLQAHRSPVHMFSDVDEVSTGLVEVEVLRIGLVSQCGFSEADSEWALMLCEEADAGMITMQAFSAGCKKFKKEKQATAVKSTVKQHIRRASQLIPDSVIEVVDTTAAPSPIREGECAPFDTLKRL